MYEDVSVILVKRGQPLEMSGGLTPAELLENMSNGAVYFKYRICSDESCSRMSGDEKHGPYKYRIYRDGDTSGASI